MADATNEVRLWRYRDGAWGTLSLGDEGVHSREYIARPRADDDAREAALREARALLREARESVMRDLRSNNTELIGSADDLIARIDAALRDDPTEADRRGEDGEDIDAGGGA